MMVLLLTHYRYLLLESRSWCARLRERDRGCYRGRWCAGHRQVARDEGGRDPAGPFKGQHHELVSADGRSRKSHIDHIDHIDHIELSTNYASDILSLKVAA